jgi:hypothetical protein
MTAAPAAGAASPPQRPTALGRELARLAIGIGAPVALYYLLRALGLSSLAALAIGAVIPALGAGYALAVRRRADWLSLLVLSTIVTSVVFSAVSGDPRFLLARDGMVTAVWGVWFLASVRARRPAAFSFARPLLEGRRMFAVRDWDALWQADPAFRRIWRVSSVMWGTGLLADAAARVVMSYTLPVSAVPALGGLLWPVTFVLLQIVTNVYYQMAGLNRMLGARRPGPARGT